MRDFWLPCVGGLAVAVLRSYFCHVGLYVMRVGDMEIPQPAHVLAGSPALSR